MRNFEIIEDNGDLGVIKAKFRFETSMLENNYEKFEINNLGDDEQKEVKEQGDNSEFLVVHARLLSKVVTQSRYFDFTEDNVLKNAVSLFNNRTVYANHEADVENWKGVVRMAEYDDKRKPEGINGAVYLDRTVDAKLCRGFEIGALNSFSATIMFEYIKSHPAIEYYYDSLGKEVDGSIVRFIVKKIKNVGEISVVWEGEDPFAKSFVKNNKEINNKKFKEEGNKMSEFKKLKDEIKEVLGVTSEDDKEFVKELLERINGLIEDNARLEKAADTGVKFLEELREKAVSMYKAAKGEFFKQSFLDNVIKKADMETAKALFEEYQNEIDKNNPLVCAKCGTKLSRKSAEELNTIEKQTDRVKINKNEFKLK